MPTFRFLCRMSAALISAASATKERFRVQNQAPTPQQVREVCQKAAELRKGKLRDTQLAFFGGSFTAIERGYMLSLLEAAKPFVGEDGFAGIRVSTRPDAINEEILTILKEYHVNAIELGVQSMNDRVLLANKRGHTAQDVVRAAGLIQEFQIELGLQMMTGLYQSTWQDDIDTAKAIAALHPKTVRIYPTITLEGTDLAALYQQGLYQPMSLEDSVKLCSDLLEFFEGAEYSGHPPGTACPGIARAGISCWPVSSSIPGTV